MITNIALIEPAFNLPGRLPQRRHRPVPLLPERHRGPQPTAARRPGAHRRVGLPRRLHHAAVRRAAGPARPPRARPGVAGYAPARGGRAGSPAGHRLRRADAGHAARGARPTIVATALPTIVGELGGLEHLSWVVTAYLLAQTIVTPLYGKLGDLYGRKRVLQIAIVLFLVGSALCGAEPEHDAAHRLPGHPGARRRRAHGRRTQAAIGDVVPPRERGRYQGIFGAVFGVVEHRRPAARRLLHDAPLAGAGSSTSTCRSASLALVVLAATLPSTPAPRRGHAIDYARRRRCSRWRWRRSCCSRTSAGRPTRGASPPIVGLGAVAAVVALARSSSVERRARGAGAAACGCSATGSSW